MADSFGEWVKLNRVGRGWNQKELAAAMKFVPSVITKVELDQQEPTADFCIAFAAVLELSVEYVLAKAGKPGYEQHLNGERDTAVQGENESQAARKIRALVAMLDSDDQERAIQLLETLVKTRRQQAGVAPRAKKA